MIKKIVIKTNIGSVYLAAICLLFAVLLWFVPLLFLKNSMPIWAGYIIVFLMVKYFVYHLLDLWVNKKIVVQEAGAFIICWGLKFKLNKETSILVIEELSLPATNNARHYSLNIHRNPKSFYKRIFKNKIKLYLVDKDNIDNAKKQAAEISDMLGIKFIDILDIDK